MNEAKHDEGKLRISLVPPQIIRDIAEVREYGNKKYHDPNNWKRVEIERYIDALLRHTLAFMEDPNGKDEESGIEHYKHIACNLAFICEMKASSIKTPSKETWVPFTMEDFVDEEAKRLGVQIAVNNDGYGDIVRMTRNGKRAEVFIPVMTDNDERMKRIYHSLTLYFGDENEPEDVNTGGDSVGYECCKR